MLSLVMYTPFHIRNHYRVQTEKENLVNKAERGKRAVISNDKREGIRCNKEGNSS